MAGGKKFQGLLPPIVTPFLPNEELDTESLRSYVSWLADSGIDGIVVLGSTGEFHTLSFEEQETVLAVALEAAKGKMKVIAGTGHSGTKMAVELSKRAERMGADAVQVMPPYYLQPTENAIRDHYKAIAEAVSIPVLLYNNPNTTKVEMSPAFVAELAQIPGIAGIKISGGGRLSPIEQAVRLRELVPDDFSILSGAPPLFGISLTLGIIDGAVVGPPAVFPHEMVELWRLAQEGKAMEARERYRPYLELALLGSYEPGPRTRYPHFYKLILKWKGLIAHDTVRRPLEPLDDFRVQLLKEALQLANIDVKVPAEATS